MWSLGPLGFTAPLLLLALVALPVLWWLLRAVPPAPIRRRFPGVALLLGLTDAETEADRTPWWLLLLRMAALAAVIVAFAGPVLNPRDSRPGAGPLLIVTDGSWADARDWPERTARIEALLEEASAAGRTAALVSLTDLPSNGAPPFQAADAWARQLPGVAPRPWSPDPAAVTAWAAELDGPFETVWLSDGLDRPWREEVLDAFDAAGDVRVIESARPIVALGPARFEEGEIVVPGHRAAPGPATEAEIVAHGPDPSGTPRELARTTLAFAEGETAAEARLVLPPEIRNRVTRFEIAGLRSAGAVSLADDSLRRREVALISAESDAEATELLSPRHYLEEALAPSADLIDGAMSDVLLANPDAIVLADVAIVSEADRMRDWVEAGGLLVRFAGPRLASADVGRAGADPLLPVALRAGGRSVGGAMSWGEPKRLSPFPPDGPFAGLAVPDDVTVSAQVLAQPGPELAARTVAALADGTPLVTRARLGEGQVVLFHVTANAEWSTLPLSGLFVQMLERLAVSAGGGRPAAEDLAGTTWQIDEVLTAFGEVEDAGTMPGIPGEDLAAADPGPDTPPGLYAGEERRIALNVPGPDPGLAPAAWPDRVVVEGLAPQAETPLKGAFLSAALLLLLADIVASLALSGRLRGARAGGAAAALALALWLAPHEAAAQQQADADTDGAALPADDPAAIARALEATSEVVLAHVLTGDGEVDRLAEAGLRGLGQVLTRRTSVEPGAPVAVDLETDELAFYPILYWPVTADQPRPSDEAYARLNRYLRTGGMIVFDTRDADIAGLGASSPAGRRLQDLAAPLDIPPLEPVPEDHVLTRAFYLLQDFPGRHDAQVWVEAAPADAASVEGMPFRDLNDNVTPVVIGGNDWAAAWAVDESGQPMRPVGRGYGGERQREIANRFGVNLVMHVLTGNYKSDQVHVPALLDRLGQ